MMPARAMLDQAKFKARGWMCFVQRVDLRERFGRRIAKLSRRPIFFRRREIRAQSKAPGS
ncbi:hypothetical protein [Paraburkholderia sacchari]|uniref:Uncharacterized protein n=1 Tax=Paraburkholderia sacchari TaxID=159450 RepID=A0A8T6ZIG7_9BURK|nr:hypothetical protein [Paraburkholderia sacchari]NLP64030.1 hypothetical protein [Paraburkholderia sacchari]